MDKNSTFMKLLDEKGLHKTNQRSEILNIMSLEDKPLSAKHIYNKLKDRNSHLKLSTIYRNLNIFAEKDIIRKLNIRNDKNENLFELIKETHHHHLICIECGEIKDIKCPLDDYLKEIEDKNNYLIKDHRLSIYGLCENCK